jgi:hypothetical protein
MVRLIVSSVIAVVILVAILAIAILLILVAAVSLWFAVGVEWTIGLFVRATPLRQFFLVTTWWAITFAVATAFYCL